MVLRFLIGVFIVWESLVPEFGFSQPAPVLEFVDGSVSANNLATDLCLAIGRESWSEEEWSAVFPVYTWDAYKKGIRQSVQGQFRLEGTTLLFTPLFPFAEGETYYAVLAFDVIFEKLGESMPEGDAQHSKQIELTFAIPRINTARTFIEAVYPATDTLPENLLRMYVYFSAPMRTGEAYQHIQIQDESGKAIEKAFLIVDQELWDTERKHFTLLFDPGRIKRGIKANLDLGMPLQRNNSYRLIIDSLWRDAHGNELFSSYKKRIFIKDADRTVLAINHWTIIAPLAGTKYPLIIRFDKPLDHALALKYISVTHPSLGIIDGVAALKQDDQLWVFTPDNPWTAGSYALQISPYLEDPAGNNFNNPFDVDLSVSARINSEEPITLVFEAKEMIK